MYFDLRTFLRAAYLSLFRSERSPAPLTFQRGLFLVFFFLLFPVVPLTNALCFWLDRIFYPEWKHVRIARPVFIVGNPRSGTTFIHRIMALDEERFFCFKTWEIIFPAVIQKRFFRKLDRWTGHVLRRLLLRMEQRIFRDFNKMHPVSLFAPEEDDYLFLHIFSAHDLVWLFPFEEMSRFLRFDEQLKASEKRRIMGFYRDCIKRQACYRSHAGALLSKAPASSARIATLVEQFPDCKIIYMVRNPLEVIPSMINLAHEVWKRMTGMGKGFPLQDEIYSALKYYYEYPLALLKKLSDDRYCIVTYEDLTRNPAETVKVVYERLGIPLTASFLSALQEEDTKARSYQSGHRYSLDQTHIKREKIVEDLGKVFDEFGFERGETQPD